MTLAFQPITLDGNAPDQEAMLVLRGERLLAVLTCLSDLHADLEGKWFVEATFGDLPSARPFVFDSTDHFQMWLGQSDEAAG